MMMEELIIYLLKSGLCLSVFFGIYWLFLKNETFYRFNRHFLLSGIVCALLLPFVQYTYTVTFAVQQGLVQHNATAPAPIAQQSFGLWLYAGLLIYTGITCFLIFRYLFGLMKIRKMISQYGYTELQGYKVVSTSIFKHSFSVFNYIFFDNATTTSPVEKKLILEHEQAHISQRHWVDLMVAQVICTVQWFNPLAWLYIKAIKQNHEFLADQAVLQKGNSPAVYRAALINHCLQVPVFQFASSFAQYDKIKRVKMMMSPASAPAKKMGVLLIIPFMAVFLTAFAKPVYHVVYKDPARNLGQEVVLQDSLKLKSVKKTAGTTKSPKQPKTPHSKSGTASMQSATAVDIKDNQVVSTQANSDTTKGTIRVRSTGFANISGKPLYIIDGVEAESTEGIDLNKIESLSILKGLAAYDKYGDRGENGVIIVTLKAAAKNAVK